MSQCLLMAEDLNGYVCSVFAIEDISSLPVPDDKFHEARSDYLRAVKWSSRNGG